MDFNASIDLIRRELDEACEIIADLKKSPGAQVIEIELARSKCRNASNALDLLKTLVKGFHEILPEDQKGNHHEILPEDHNEDHHEVLPEIHNENPDPKLPEDVHVNHPEDIEETDPDLMIIGNEDIPDTGKPYVAPIIADSFSHLASRFNEQAGMSQDEPSYMKKKHLSSLADAIGVNDRFYYIREVFGGNKEAYSNALSYLENVQDLQEARGIILNFRMENTENEAVKQLLDLVKRKLTSDE